MWYVDFRPVGSAQLSQYTSLDPDTHNNISFFIVKHDNRLKVAMRTYGVFKNKGCVTYEVMDTVKESKGYYRFSDFQSGDERAYTEFTFKKDGFLMEVYTNKFNRVKPLQLHSRFEAKLSDRSSAFDAIKHFNYPQPVMVKDLLIPGGFLPFFIILFLAIFFTLSIVFGNTRRGLIVSLAVIVFLILRLVKLGNWLNLLLIIGIAFALESYFSRKI